MSIKRRYFQSESRAESKDGGKMEISGWGAVFNQYANMNWFVEVIQPGFFDSANMDECACLFNHDPNIILGRKKSGTLELSVEPDGLAYRAVLPESRKDVYEAIQRGDVYQSSFAFTIRKAKWEQRDPNEFKGVLSESEIQKLTYGGKIDVRILEEADRVYDVSPVVYPAYSGASVSAYSESEQELKEERSAFLGPRESREAVNRPQYDEKFYQQRQRIVEAMERGANL